MGLNLEQGNEVISDKIERWWDMLPIPSDAGEVDDVEIQGVWKTKWEPE